MAALLGRTLRSRGGIRFAVLGLVAILVAGACDAAPGPTASASTAPAPAATPTTSSPRPSDGPADTPSATPAPSGSPADLAPGVLAVTVTDDLRVRSAPRVAGDSIRHAPLLPRGTELVVTAGPVEADDYTWYRVAPLGLTLDDGVDQGWVAVADHDGTPWVASADDPTPGFELASVKADPIDPSMATARARASGINRFGIAMYKRLRASDELAGKGIVFSPYSIATALAMARAGARGGTASEMDHVLRADEWPSLSKGTASLAQVLARRDGAWIVEGEGDRGVHFLALRIANMAFAQDGYALEQAYMERVSRTFRSGVGLVDYIGRTDEARDAINRWVGVQTMGRIPTLLQPPDLTDATRLVLVNAIYFKGEWLVPFDEAGTVPHTFTTAAGKEIRVPTMFARGGQSIPLATGDGWRATELRYRSPDDHQLAMTIVVPDDLAAFEKGLDAEQLTAVTKAVAREHTRLQKVTDPADPEGCPEYAYSTRLFLPRFGTETRANLSETLIAMGMPLAFDTSLADFSGMTKQDALHIGMVVHQANIDVDERGTEAAAATAVGIDTGGCTGPVPRTDRTLRVNKPFLYLVRDLQTGAILFMGRVTDPTQR
jgi:serpin B